MAKDEKYIQPSEPLKVSHCLIIGFHKTDSKILNYSRIMNLSNFHVSFVGGKNSNRK